MLELPLRMSRYNTVREWRCTLTPGIEFRILSVCDDPGLSRSREWLLQSAGFQVQSRGSDWQPDKAIAREAAIAVICHSIEEERADWLVRRLRQLNPDIRVLEILPYGSWHRKGKDAECRIEEGPVGFLTVVASLVSASRTGRPLGTNDTAARGLPRLTDLSGRVPDGPVRQDFKSGTKGFQAWSS
jgi:hypothetical protein